jgi:tetratricopeptide (TPR) repeat protein
VAEHPRIEELRRRVQKDKASIAFAQLAEEYRRAGRFAEAIETCRTGLAHHPGYLSAHVTLGRALIETGELEQAHAELAQVLVTAPENLAALKGVADIHFRRGQRQEALDYYRRALEFAPHDPDLEHLVAQIARDVEPARPSPEIPGGLSFEEAMGEFLALHGDAPPDQPVQEATPVVVPVAEVEAPVLPGVGAPDTTEPAGTSCPEPGSEVAPTPVAAPEPATPVTAVPAEGQPAGAPPAGPERAAVQIEALERWLDAILADRQSK